MIQKILLTLVMSAVFANAQADDDKAAKARMNKAVDEIEKVDDFCLSIYHQTIDKKETDLTIKQSKAIPACEAIRRYREKLSYEEALDEFKHLNERQESGESDRENAVRKFLLTLIPATPAKTKSKPKAKA
jgi:hypothetical protein